MKNLDLITFDEFGQGVINFDSLEAITSKEFVQRVKIYISIGSILVKNIKISKYYVSVYFASDTVFSIYQFDKDTFDIEFNVFNYSDLKYLGLEVISNG